jgi:hypothetical protein
MIVNVIVVLFYLLHQPSDLISRPREAIEDKLVLGIDDFKHFVDHIDGLVVAHELALEHRCTTLSGQE